MKRLAVLGFACLAGCVSTQSALNKNPTEVVHSTKSVNEVSFCIANKNNVPALDGPDGAKVIQIKNSVGAVGMIFSVYPEGTGSRIEFRKVIGVGIAAHKQCY